MFVFLPYIFYIRYTKLNRVQIFAPYFFVPTFIYMVKNEKHKNQF